MRPKGASPPRGVTVTLLTRHPANTHRGAVGGFDGQELRFCRLPWARPRPAQSRPKDEVFLKRQLPFYGLDLTQPLLRHINNVSQQRLAGLPVAA